MAIFKDHKQLGAPSMVFVTPAYGLDHPVITPHLHKMSTPRKAPGILSQG